MKITILLITLFGFFGLTYAQTDNEIRQILIQQSIRSYNGQCPCPYSINRKGKSCGGYSAYSKPGGASPLCYPADISQNQVNAYRQLNAIKQSSSVQQSVETIVEQPVIINKQPIIKKETKPPIVLTEVTTTGFGKNKDAALIDAYYNAIQNAIGVYVSSETIIVNGELVKDRVATEVKGLIPRYEVIEPYDGKKIKITAYVDVENAKKTLGKK